MFNALFHVGVPKFILISVHDYNLPSFLLSTGYFIGKRKAESEVLTKYPSSGILTVTILSYIKSQFCVLHRHSCFTVAGVVLRPGFIYGKRKIDGFEIPLNLIGEPLERLLSTKNFAASPLRSLPASDLLLAPLVSVDDVAFAVLNAVIDDDFFGVYTIEQIKEAAAKQRT